jgi:hypothetical protein
MAEIVGRLSRRVAPSRASLGTILGTVQAEVKMRLIRPKHELKKLREFSQGIQRTKGNDRAKAAFIDSILKRKLARSQPS